MKRITIWISWLALACLATTAAAEPPEPPFMQQLYPPELIMRHAREMGLTPEQRSNITSAISETQASTLELQWDMQDAARALGELVSQTRVDEDAALDAAARVMAIEGQLKRSHLGLLIRIKNALDAGQQKQLRALRSAESSTR